MRKRVQFLMFGLVVFSLTFSSGCYGKNNPKEVVKDFISAVKLKNAAKIEKDLSFERLLLEKAGEDYLKMPHDKASRRLEEFKNNMVAELISGNLRYFGEIEPISIKESANGEKAEVIVENKKENNRIYVFSLIREGGAWKIYRIENR